MGRLIIINTLITHKISNAVSNLDMR